MWVERQFQPRAQVTKTRRAAHSVEFYRSSSFAARLVLEDGGVRLKLRTTCMKQVVF
jgi:hypothetical protein